MRKSIVAVVLQAVSIGRINATPACLNIIMVGAPGCGKGIVQRVAALLNAVSARISSNSVTPAGLTGYSERVGNNRTRVHFGKLALAHLGVALMEDLQHIDTHSHRHTFGILCDMMELARLLRTTNTDVDIPVETAFLGDVNPLSTTRPANVGREVIFLRDLNLPVNFLSRVDLVLVFPRDVAQRMETLFRIVSAVQTVGPVEELDADPRVRELKVLIALLRDSCATVKVDGVTEMVNTKLQELLACNHDKLESLELASDFLLRAGKSILKLVAAAARLRGSCVADKTDVELAFDLFEEKMRFLSLIEPSFEHVRDWKSSPDAKQHRARSIVEHYGGKSVTIAQIAGMFPGVKRRTLQRDLNSLGAASDRAGNWLIPETYIKQS